MKLVSEGALGLVLAAATWAALESTQAAWLAATTRAPRTPVLQALGLLAAGALLVVLARPRRVPTVSVFTAAISLLVAVGPIVLGMGSWWPRTLPGSALSLGASPGTYLAIGVFLALGVARLSLPSSSRRRPLVPSRD